MFLLCLGCRALGVHGFGFRVYRVYRVDMVYRV